MSKLETNISRVVGKMQLLTKKYQALQKDNEKLQAELKEKSDNEAALLLKVKLLQQQLDIVQIASTNNADEQTRHQLEKRLNDYIKELDQCITLLSASDR